MKTATFLTSAGQRRAAGELKAVAEGMKQRQKNELPVRDERGTAGATSRIWPGSSVGR